MKKKKKEKRKAAKKAMKEKKAERRAKEQAKKLEKEEKDKLKRLSKEANKVKTKVAPLLAGFASVLGDSLSKQLPCSNTRAGQKFVKGLTKFEEEARDILATTRGEWTVSFDIMEQQCTSAKKELALLEGFMAALRKHQA